MKNLGHFDRKQGVGEQRSRGAGSREQGAGNKESEKMRVVGYKPTSKKDFFRSGAAQEKLRPYFNPTLLSVGSLLPAPCSLLPAPSEF